MDLRGQVRLASVVALIAACASTEAPETAPEETSGRAFYDQNVQPLLESQCAQPGCHGVPDGEDHGDLFGGRFLGLPIDAEGRVAGADRADRGYASAKLFINPYEADARYSSLVRKVLARALGGDVHDGPVSFENLDDPGYRTLTEWIAMETGGGEGIEAGDLNGLERLFGDTVMPVLIKRRCLTGNCHGPNALLSTLRQKRAFGEVLAADRVRSNRNNARKFISLDGPATVSRLLLKGLPIAAGGILHKGGNDNFFRGFDDPDVQAIRGWIEAEAKVEMGSPPVVSGMLFVRGPAEPRPAFDVTTPHWGSDILFADITNPDAPTVNLTAAHHDGPADVRDPALDHDALRVAFAMRRGVEDAMNLYEMDLDGGALRQLTFDTVRADGFVPVNVQPTYGPDGHIYFASTRSGELGDRGLRPNTDIYEIDPECCEVRRRTYGPNQEVRPSFLRYGGVGGELAFTSTRRFGDVFNAPVFRFPPGLASEYHVHFGTQRDGEMLLGIRDTPFGLHLVTSLPVGSAWGGGRLAAIDRNFGPDITDEARVGEATLPRFAHTLTYLADAERGLYRDAVPLPDGRLLAARSLGAVDITDPGANVDYGIVFIDLGRSTEGRLLIADETTLVDAPGLADLSPVPVVRRARAPTKGHHTDYSSETGTINMFNFPLLQALVEVLEPRARTLREDLRYVRIVAAHPLTAEQMAPVDPGEVRNGDPASNRMTNGVHDPVAVLGTVPLGRDGSFYVEIPANLAVRFQALNEDKMAVGAQHERWVFANPGEELFHSTHIDVYASRCAGCHGAIGDTPTDALVPEPDAVTGASVSHSTHQDANALRPLEPILVGVDAARRPTSFVTDVQPILDQSCAVAGCHAGQAPAARLSLTSTPTTHYNDAYESLLAVDPDGGQRHVDERGARAISSQLVARIYGRQLEAPRDPNGQCPPAGSDVAPLTEEERLRFVEWIDLGATFGPTP